MFQRNVHHCSLVVDKNMYEAAQIPLDSKLTHIHLIFTDG